MSSFTIAAATNITSTAATIAITSAAATIIIAATATIAVTSTAATITIPATATIALTAAATAAAAGTATGAIGIMRGLSLGVLQDVQGPHRGEVQMQRDQRQMRRLQDPCDRQVQGCRCRRRLRRRR